MSSFLDDIREETTAHLIATGNLLPSPPKPRPTWTSLGYRAEIDRRICTCGAPPVETVRIYHREESSDGAIRAQLLDTETVLQFPPAHLGRVEILPRRVTVCPACLTAHGFTLPESEPENA
jgi:hypothetical protein